MSKAWVPPKRVGAPAGGARAAKTRAALRDALIDLIGCRDWEDVSVQDICERAGVARSTFYLHYAGKTELLVGGLRDLEASLGSGRKTGSSMAGWRGFSFLTGLLQHVHENRKVFQSVIGSRRSLAVRLHFQAMTVRLISRELPRCNALIPEQARARCLAALFTELIGWWVDHGRTEPEEMALNFDRVAAAIFDVART